MDYDESNESDDVTIDCPQCGQSFYEDAPQCPDCGHIPLRNEDRPAVWTTGVILLMVAAMAWPFLLWLWETFPSQGTP
jgi:uncharacterized protein (DUF983 family)